ncbi:MAG: 16S rRNA (uracil(1498)-N(3))-methyltransferase [Rhodocyclaceae bacterium]|nr:16S rRNA (uracil(1498)-N(3))-methyltransferase [Rhodocyclaceae bacterium]
MSTPAPTPLSPAPTARTLHQVDAHCHVEARLGPGARIELPRELAHHLGRVLRLADGATLSLFDGSGPAWLARLHLAGSGPATAEVLAALQDDRESPLRVVLGQGLSSGDRMDITVQKAVELGIAGIAPLATARAVVKLAGDRAERRREHWQRIAIAACEQCKRSVVPPVEAVQGLRQWLAGLPPEAPKWLLCAHQGQRLADLPRPAPGQTGYLLAGPEGGFTDEERALAIDAGFVPLHLGPRVLRTETAALAALAAMQVVWGDF